MKLCLRPRHFLPDATTDLANCTATVAEFNTCLQDSLAAAKARFAKLDTTCDSLSLDGGGLGPSMNDIPPPASCNAVYAKCAVLDGSGSGN